MPAITFKVNLNEEAVTTLKRCSLSLTSHGTQTDFRITEC